MRIRTGGKWPGGFRRVRDVGHEQAQFAEFYRVHRAACLKAVVAGTGDRQGAEDLVAEAFTRAWMSWRKVSRHPAPQAWVVRTALNVRVSAWRRRRREVTLADEHDVVIGPDSGGWTRR